MLYVSIPSPSFPTSPAHLCFFLPAIHLFKLSVFITTITIIVIVAIVVIIRININVVTHSYYLNQDTLLSLITDRRLQ